MRNDGSKRTDNRRTQNCRGGASAKNYHHSLLLAIFSVRYRGEKRETIEKIRTLFSHEQECPAANKQNTSVLVGMRRQEDLKKRRVLKSYNLTTVFKLFWMQQRMQKQEASRLAQAAFWGEWDSSHRAPACFSQKSR